MDVSALAVRARLLNSTLSKNLFHQQKASMKTIGKLCEVLKLQPDELIRPLTNLAAAQPADPHTDHASNIVFDASFHARLNGTREEVETAKRLLIAIAQILDASPNLLEFEWARPTSSLDVGMAMRWTVMREFVRAFVDGKFDHFLLPLRGSASIDWVRLPRAILDHEIVIHDKSGIFPFVYDQRTARYTVEAENILSKFTADGFLQIDRYTNTLLPPDSGC